jgi:hypothetical protein
LALNGESSPDPLSFSVHVPETVKGNKACSGNDASRQVFARKGELNAFATLAAMAKRSPRDAVDAELISNVRGRVADCEACGVAGLLLDGCGPSGQKLEGPQDDP